MLILLGTILCSVSAGPDVPLAVMSFNLRYGDADDGENSWARRKEVLTGLLRQYEPDVLGTQECLGYQAEFIAQTLPQYRWVGVGREVFGGGEMAAIFYKKDKLNPIETGNFWLSETPDKPGSKSWSTVCTRIVTWVKFRHPGSGRFFYFFNTHFDHGSEQAREESAKLLAKRIADVAGELPVIVTGDFNASAGACPAWQTLTESGLQDAWVTAAERKGPEITYGGFKPPEGGQKDRIDWILVRGPVKVAQAETVLYNENGHYASDHYPVLTRLALTQP